MDRRPSRRGLVQGVGAAGLVALLAGCGRLPWQAKQPPEAVGIEWLNVG